MEVLNTIAYAVSLALITDLGSLGGFCFADTILGH